MPLVIGSPKAPSRTKKKQSRKPMTALEVNEYYEDVLENVEAQHQKEVSELRHELWTLKKAFFNIISTPLEPKKRRDR
jgi:hypothetical protein